MGSILCKIDDKHVPLYRIMWVSELPHFCGHDDCEKEGHYEVRLEQDESLWAASRRSEMRSSTPWNFGGEDSARNPIRVLTRISGRNRPAPYLSSAMPRLISS